MAEPIVKCHVDRCTYWDEGDVCRAEKILVDFDEIRKNGFDLELALEPNAKPKEIEKADTCCQTFKPKK